MELFRCSPLSATLSPMGCARLFAKFQNLSPKPWEHSAPCRGCSIGASNALELAIVAISRAVTQFQDVQTRLAPVCPRCVRAEYRIILNCGLCVSCYNRAREVLVGRDRKGRVPVRLKARIFATTLSVRDVGGDWRAVSFPAVSSEIEAAIRILKTSVAPVEIAVLGRVLGVSDLVRLILSRVTAAPMRRRAY